MNGEPGSDDQLRAQGAWQTVLANGDEATDALAAEEEVCEAAPVVDDPGSDDVPDDD